jgi:hypothetical protein
LKITRIIVLIILTGFSHVLSAQTKESKPSLKETVAWMENFSSQHAFLMLKNQLIQSDAVYAGKDCSIAIGVSFSNATKSDQTKTKRAGILLSDFDPNSVRVNTDKDAGTYEVEFERSDSAPKIEEATEMGDGTKSKMWVSEEIFFFDSEDSARRFSRALVHAINLCGGAPAPF